jgi:hypothetical protein
MRLIAEICHGRDLVQVKDVRASLRLVKRQDVSFDSNDTPSATPPTW